ncbi:hypothetical protein BDV19DRAFT_212148 [Aspergillus venezuelensis]
MAPLPYQPPSTPLIQEPSPIIPSFPPSQTTSFIPRKLFLQLLAGTVGIFILTVLFWKLPQFLRFFTKARVLAGGNKPSTRYAKTWYGWVSAGRHKARKRALRKFMARMRGWPSWGSSKADFEWVWWDPGPGEHRKRQDATRPRMSRWARWYDLAIAEAMYSHMNPPSPRSSRASHHANSSSLVATGALSPLEAPPSIPTPLRGPTRTSSSLNDGFGDIPPHSKFHRRPQLKVTTGPRPYTTPGGTREFVPRSKRLVSGAFSCNTLGFMSATRSSPQNLSMPCLSPKKPLCAQPRIRSKATASFRDIRNEGQVPNISPVFCRSRKYQVWSARMGLQTLDCIGTRTRTLPRVPPGSPKSAILGSLSFDSSVLEHEHQYQQTSKMTSSSDISDFALGGEQQICSGKPLPVHTDIAEGSSRGGWHSLPLLGGHRLHRPTLMTWHEGSVSDQQDSITRVRLQRQKPTTDVRKRHRKRKSPHFVLQAKDWSNWEVRLIYHLDKKLAWEADQLTPGQRPFHFALLANHWLNRETWIVYDPVSRVNTEKRREWGDPRFNVPYPAPAIAPTPKYPTSNHRRAHTPAITSWRDSVNQHRVVSGQKPIMRAIELYESSAEDPPDGKIDPSCWVLRKPPQGISLSARQKEEYYEGGAGWQETLNDWQRIKRGYRIRKAIYEGRVNRNRAKEIAYGITRCYRQATLGLNRPFSDSCVEGSEVSIEGLS